MCIRLPEYRAVLGLVGALALVVCPSCGTTSRPPDPRRYVPGAGESVRALEQALDAWRNGPGLERTVATLRPVMFVDQQRRPAQRLVRYEVLGESPGSEAYRRFWVKLWLEQPEEAITASYYVFGQGQVWVYRAEDLDMLLHMDHSMMAAAAREAAEADPNAAPAAAATGPAAQHAHGHGAHAAPAR